jgi:hypothetical protein
MGAGDVHTEFWCGSLKKRGPLEDLGVDVTIILKRILRKSAERPWTGLIWLR